MQRKKPTPKKKQVNFRLSIAQKKRLKIITTVWQCDSMTDTLNEMIDAAWRGQNAV